MNLRKCFKLSLLACLGLFFAMRDGANAATLHVNYVVPQGVDPVTIINLTALNTPETLTGAQFLDLAGVEVHGRIPGTAPSTFLDITRIRLTYDFDGAVTVNPIGQFGFTPWSFQLGTGFIDFIATPSSAPLNDNLIVTPGGLPSFGAFFSRLADATPDELRRFESSQLTITATRVRGGAVPEPGATTLVFAVLSAGAVVLLRRRTALREASCRRG